MRTRCKHGILFEEDCFLCEPWTPETCHFCGGDTFDCDCTTACAECGHVSHEHYADGRCRGTVYFSGPMHVEDCPAHEYRPAAPGLLAG